MKFITVISFVLLSTPTFADITGDWIGWAHWTFQGSGTKCDASVSYIETENELRRVNGLIDCGMVYSEMIEETFSKKNGKMYLQGEEVGTYSDSSYEWTEMYNESTAINVKLNNKKTSMDYAEKWMDLSRNREIYDIQARLFRKNQ